MIIEKNFSLWIVVLLGILLVALALESVSKPGKEANECEAREVQRTVQGDSLRGLVNEGEIVTIILDYYKCNPISRNDLVAYGYAGRENSIIKLVKGIPGDTFRLVSADEETGISDSWNIVLNGIPLVNFEDTPYLVGGKGYRILHLYEESYGGVIPDNAYLLLGSGPWGSLDSSEFGLVDGSDIVGKVVSGSR